MKRCPFCGARQIGRIGRERYYCRECCHEWTGERDDIKIYQILSDGTVASLKIDIEQKLESESKLSGPRFQRTVAAKRRRAG